MTTSLEEAKHDLAALNRILDREGILDAFGHVSVRHPMQADRFLLSRARSAGNVEVEDILEFDLEGSAVALDVEAPLYLERFIHAATYAARPDIAAICHNHTLSILPFSISTSTRLHRTINASKVFGEGVPIWDIADEFGSHTDMLVRTIEQGRSLATSLGDGGVVLMRGHGSVVVASHPRRLVNACLAMERGAKAQLSATVLGGLRPFTEIELAPHDGLPGGLAEDNRAWEYFLHRAHMPDELPMEQES